MEHRLRGFADTRPSLIHALANGTAEPAWREFFELYAPAVYKVALLRGLRPADAEDVVQRVMMGVLEQVRGGFEYSRERGRFRSWVRRIAEHKIADVMRARARRPAERQPAAIEGEAAAEDPADDWWSREWRRQDLLYCLSLVEADLAPRRMEAFRLYALRGVSAKETAERLGMTVGHVYVVRSLVLGLIQKHMERLERNGGQADSERSP